jgi:hypothetical protein
MSQREAGIAPSLKGMEFNTHNLFHRYGEAPSIITAFFDNGTKIKIYIGPDAEIHAVIFSADDSVVRSRAAAPEGLLPRVEIMPQVAPLSRSETVLSQDYVRSNLSSSLAHQHFRNQINLLREHLPTLMSLTSETWPGLQIQELIGGGVVTGRSLELMVRNDDFVAEAAVMGHGVQMWLQTMWFLSRVSIDATVILDEPDVYMHPDLQRRLIRYLRRSRKQICVTTHSVEIMSEVEPDEVLIIDRRQESSKFTTSLPAVQKVLDHVGSAHNLQLARLWHARKSIIVEGKDFKILCAVFDVLFPSDREGLFAVPNMSIGGWGGWQYAIGSSMFLHNSAGEEIKVYCILDSDYHTSEQRAIRLKQAQSFSVQLHIWSMKEIENYFINSSVIQRVIEHKTPKRTQIPGIEEIDKFIDVALDGYKEDVFDAMSAELLAEDRSLGAAGANKKARKSLNDRWGTRQDRISVVSGKALMARISEWSQDEFGVSMSAMAVAKFMMPSDVPSEMKNVISSIAMAGDFS